MKVQPLHQKFLTENSLFVLHQLPEKIQVVAIQNVLEAERKGFLVRIADARAAIKENLHACINNRYFIYSINQTRIKLRCPNYCRSFVMSNLCEFKADGTYYTYTDKL